MSQPKRIVILKGSPRRNGNSNMLADQVAAGAQTGGAEVTTFFLQEMRLEGCSGCDACQQGMDEDCIIDDDMVKIYPKLKTADAIVLASAVYTFTITAQLKACIDRWYAFDRPGGHLLGSKTLALLLTFGDSDIYTSGGVNAIGTYKDLVRYLKANSAGILYGSASKAGEIAGNKALMDDAYKLGKQLAAG
jgi:multimeric flavodoxin WrbA